MGLLRKNVPQNHLKAAGELGVMFGEIMRNIKLLSPMLIVFLM